MRIREVSTAGSPPSNSLVASSMMPMAKARGMVEAVCAKGDAEAADTWLPIAVAIGELGTPPTERGH